MKKLIALAAGTTIIPDIDIRGPGLDKGTKQ